MQPGNPGLQKQGSYTSYRLSQLYCHAPGTLVSQVRLEGSGFWIEMQVDAQAVGKVLAKHMLMIEQPRRKVADRAWRHHATKRR
jgi:hypothetical protein